MVAFSVYYFGQGVPIGLFTVALPPFLIARGADASEVAALIAITGLPWAFKLIVGPVMDRFSFLPMGRRRPWVMFAQLGLTISVLSLATISDPVAELWWLIMTGFVINSFSATQDVAVDGMAIDVLPKNERGRANAFMAFGQVAGFSAFGALNGYLLQRFGLAVTAIVSSATIALILVFVTLTRERTGERMLPWTPGKASVRIHEPAQSFLAIFKDLGRVVFLPMSLLLVGVEFVSRAAAGISVSVLPVIAVQDLGYSSVQYAYWFGLTGGISAVVGLFIGPVIDRVGATKILMGALIASAVTVITFGLATAWWSVDAWVVGMLALGQILSQALFVSIIATFMGICWSKVAATQFAIYMSLANLGRSTGAGLFALIATDISATDALFLIAGLFAVAAVMLTMYDHDKHTALIETLDSP